MSFLNPIRQEEQFEDSKLSRDFKGIWVPKEIWLHKGISTTSKMLWAEIYSLHDERYGGCWASEEYLCEFMGIQRRRFYDILKELTNEGLIERVSYDGRRVIRKAIVPTSNAHLGCRKVHCQSAEKCTIKVQKNALPSYIENKAKRKEENTHREKSKNVCVLSIGSHVKIKQQDLDDLIETHGKSLIDSTIDAVNDYCAANGKSYRDYAAAIRNFIKRESERKVAKNQKVPESLRQPEAKKKSLWDDYDARMKMGGYRIDEDTYKQILENARKSGDPTEAKGYLIFDYNKKVWSLT